MTLKAFFCFWFSSISRAWADFYRTCIALESLTAHLIGDFCPSRQCETVRQAKRRQWWTNRIIRAWSSWLYRTSQWVLPQIYSLVHSVFSEKALEMHFIRPDQHHMAKPTRIVRVVEFPPLLCKRLCSVRGHLIFGKSGHCLWTSPSRSVIVFM